MVRILSIREQIHGTPEKPKTAGTFVPGQLTLFQKLKNHLIKEIAKKTLVELAISLVFAGITCLFIATPIGMITLLACTVAVVALNILLRSLGAYCNYRLLQLKHDDSLEALSKKERFRFIFNLTQYLAPMAFSEVVDQNTRDLVMHEGGHALAAHVLIKHPRTRISIEPFEGGITTYRLGPLTKIGEYFGRAKTQLIISAAGPALSIVSATAGIAASLALKKSHPEISRYLNVVAADSIAKQVFYALSALWKSAVEKGHDFLHLMAGGVHPVVAALSMLVIPLLVKLGFYIYDKIKAKQTEKSNRFESQHIGKNYKILLTPKTNPPKDHSLDSKFNNFICHIDKK